MGPDHPPLTGLACPFCGSTDVETVGAWGGQLITSQVRCRNCNTYFEALRDVFDENPADD
jgi:transcription elongation factor Elf1